MPQVGAAIAAWAVAATAATTATVAAITWASVAAFLVTPFGSLILGIGLALISGLFRKKEAPSTEASKINVRMGEPERWISAGVNRQGGGIVFAEYDADGNFWYVVIHSDSILASVKSILLDDVEVTLDGVGDVVTDDFCLDSAGDLYGGTGTRVPYFNIQTTTYTAGDPTPPAIASLAAAFVGLWTADHKLVGTTYSVVRIKAVKVDNRYKIFKWRGPIGMGEPSLTIVGEWSKVYDPRDITQILGDKSTYKFSKNPVLIWAWFRTERYGRNKPNSAINWVEIATQANICDQNVTDISGNVIKRYECGLAIPESTDRNSGEQEILLTCDAQLVFDDDGKCWPRVGYYYAPVVKLTRNRDIVAMESVEAQNGESVTQGVIVRYTDPSAKYAATPCAPWVNPLYAVPGTTPKYLTVTALGIQNHNQAMRLAKTIGHRSQPDHKLLPTVGLRGLKARQHRVVNILYDNTFSGDYEIVTPVEIDAGGAFCGFGIVPVDASRWDLLPGEEKIKPIVVDSQSYFTPTLPVSVVLSIFENKIKASYDFIPRDDWLYEFEYQSDLSGGIIDDNWEKMTVGVLFALSGTLMIDVDYYVRWRTVSTGGKASDWVTPIPMVNSSSLTLNAVPVTIGTVGVVYAGFTIGVTGGNPAYIFIDTYSKLPTGLTIDPFSGLVSGTPTTIGTYSGISIKVTDARANFKVFPDFEIVIT